MDDLLHFVRHEVAMDGDDGTPIDRLDSFLDTYYARAAESASKEPSSSSSITSQNIDESFRDFVWKQLASLPELKVAFLRKLPSSAAIAEAAATPGAEDGSERGSTPALGPVPSSSTAMIDADGQVMDQGIFNLKNKAKIKAARKDSKRDRDARLTGDQYEFVEIPDEEIQSLSRAELLEKYGDTLRIAADPETCYVALTGSHERYGKLTQLVYQILQAIARGRENGKTVVDLGKEFEHDQKSLFHFVKSLVELNFIVKIRVLDAKSQTSRCIHRHYLETSSHWATWMTKDPNTDDKGVDDDDEANHKPAPLSLMTIAHLNSNEPLVRSRIIKALRDAPEGVVAHVDLVFAIGFHARPPKLHRRRLNRIITSMQHQGILEKVGVSRQGARGLLSCLKLTSTWNQPRDGAEDDENARSTPEDDDVETRPNILLTVTVERQVLDLLVSAGPEGLTIRQLQAALGDIPVRSLETLLTRMEKTQNPPHLCDYRIQSVYETYGREKRLRYFTVAGHHERCRLDGLGDLPDLKDFSHPDLAGGFAILNLEEFYKTPNAFKELAENMQTSVKTTGGRKAAALAAARRNGTSTAPVKRGRPKKQVAQEANMEVKESGAVDSAAGTEAVENPKKKAKGPKQKPEKGPEGEPKKKGRPRKSQPQPEASTQSSATEMPHAETPVTASPSVQAVNAPVPAPVPADVPVPTSLAGSTNEGTTDATKRPRSATESADDEENPQPKKKGKARKSDAVDENAPPPIKGRPRKYPPGTTSSQRKKILDERRALGLEAPSKRPKKGAKGANGDISGSVAPSVGSPAPDASMLEGLADTADQQGALRVSGDTTMALDQTSPSIPLAEAAPVPLEVLQAVSSAPAVQAAVESTVAPDQGDIPVPAMASDQPVQPEILSVSAPVADATEAAPSVSEATKTAEPAALQIPKKRGRPKKINPPTEATSSVITQDAVPSIVSPGPVQPAKPAQETATSAEQGRPVRSTKKQKLDTAVEIPKRTGKPRKSQAAASTLAGEADASTSLIDQPLATGVAVSPSSIAAPPPPEAVSIHLVPKEEEQYNTFTDVDSVVPVTSATDSLQENGAEADTRAPEIIAQAVETVDRAETLRTPNETDIIEASSDLPVANISLAHEEGREIAADSTTRPTEIPSSAIVLNLPAMPEPLPADPIDAEEHAPMDIAPHVTIVPPKPDVEKSTGPERRNYSMQVHETEFLATLQDAGGIAEDNVPLNRLWQEFMHRKDPSKPMPRPLDRRTMKGVSAGLEKRGLVKRSVLQIEGTGGRLIQRPIMYLASIGLDSQKMRDFAIDMQTKLEGHIGPTKNWLTGRKTVDKTNEMPLASRKKKKTGDAVQQAPTDPRQFFIRNWRIVAQFFGWHYGFLARVRALHEHLASSITDDNDSSFIVSSDPNIRIFASPFILLDTPLKTFLKIVAIVEYSEELDKFLKENDCDNVTIRNLPTSLSALFGSRKTRGYSRFSQIFDVMVMFKLLVPLEQVEYETQIVTYSGAAREPKYFAPCKAHTGGAYWLLTNQAPLYDLQEREGANQDLLGQLPVQSPEQVARYWDTLQGVVFGTVDRSQIPPATINYAPHLDAPPALILTARSSLQWRSQYLLLAPQKTYLRRAMDEAVSKTELLADESKVQQLAYNICAPVDVVQAYFAKPQHGARPQWQRRKRGPSKKQKARLSDSSASEAEGPKAPLPKSQKTAEAAAARKKRRNDAKAAKMAESVQERIAKKALGAPNEKQVIWDGIINGFRMRHGAEALQSVGIDFLRTWFLSPEGPNASIVQRHLDEAVAGLASMPAQVPTRPILPPTAGKLGKVMHQSKKMTVKPVKKRRAGLPAGEGETAFVLSELPELPEVAASTAKKTAAGGWTPEEDEQLYDLYVILQWRANSNGTKLSLEPIIKFHQDCKSKVFLDRLRRLVSEPGEAAYLDALQEAWARLWQYGRIKDRLLHEAVRNPTKEGLLLLRRVLNGLLNKKSIRFQAIMPKDAVTAVKTMLPADPANLQEDYIVEETKEPEDPESPKIWAYLWSTTTTAQKTAIYNHQPFRTSWKEDLSNYQLSSSERLKVFKSRYSLLDDKIEPEAYRDAHAFENRLNEEGEIEWSPICEDGDMLAVANLFSDQLLDFSVDTSVTRSGRPYTDYRTRRIDDDNFENTLIVIPNEAFSNRTEQMFANPDKVMSNKQTSRRHLTK